MSILDDLCDACGAYSDPIGNSDCARAFTRKLWCGQCSVDGDTQPIIHWLYLNGPMPKNAR